MKDQDKQQTADTAPTEPREVGSSDLLEKLSYEADSCRQMAERIAPLTMSITNCFRWKEEAYRHAMQLISNDQNSGAGTRRENAMIRGSYTPEKNKIPPPPQRERSSRLSKAPCSPADRIDRILREERDLARSQMADELRAQFSHVERVSRMVLMEEIVKAERAEANTSISGQRN